MRAAVGHHPETPLRPRIKLDELRFLNGAVVRHVAKEIEHAELFITGRGHLDESMGHLRTHAYEIIANAACPVISL